MSYLAQSDLARDELLLHRATACAASEGITDNPVLWVAQRLWALSATPGWATQYAESDEYLASEHRAGMEAPAVAGASVISDAQLQARIQELIQAEGAEGNG